MFCFRVKRTRFGEELLEVILLISFLAMLASIHHCYSIIWLALLVAIALVVVVVVAGKAITLLFFLIGPS